MLKKIINPWRNNPQYHCFGCCPDNPIGLHMEFYSTLIDEVCGWVVTRKLQTSGYTVQLNVKFRKAVPTTEPELTIRAKVTRQVRNLATSMRRSSTQEVKSAMRARPSIS